jgi:hypothetical protein
MSKTLEEFIRAQVNEGHLEGSKFTVTVLSGLPGYLDMSIQPMSALGQPTGEAVDFSLEGNEIQVYEEN